MSSKEQTSKTDKASSTQRSPNSASKSPARQQSRLASIIQRAELDPSTLTQADIIQLQRTIGNQAVAQLLADETQTPPIQKTANKTGLPDKLKVGIENLSGLSMDDVRVHYNSSKPAQLQALAYTQGTDIHVGPGQERHLPHEAWHVVQQMERRVKPTMQMVRVSINNEVGLEKEADTNGNRALHTTRGNLLDKGSVNSGNTIIQRNWFGATTGGVIGALVGAAIGSMFPVIGTKSGVRTGAMIGNYAGRKATPKSTWYDKTAHTWRWYKTPNPYEYKVAQGGVRPVYISNFRIYGFPLVEAIPVYVKRIHTDLEFKKFMRVEYKDDFVNTIKNMSENRIDEKVANSCFETFIDALYQHKILGYSKGYGNYIESGDPSKGEKMGRKEHVDAFHNKIWECIQQGFAPVEAKGQTLLWSNFGIGRFAANDKDILEAAHVKGDAQPMNKTQMGKLMDELEIANVPDKDVLIWDIQANVWSSISKEFASNARGVVHVFVPQYISSGSIFWKVELPELRKNEHVEKIYVHNLTKDAFKRVNDIDQSNPQKDQMKKAIMTEEASWESNEILHAYIEMPPFLKYQIQARQKAESVNKKGYEDSLQKLFILLIRADKRLVRVEEFEDITSKMNAPTLTQTTKFTKDIRGFQNLGGFTGMYYPDNYPIDEQE